MPTPEPARPGRPRDPLIDDAVLAATLELLADEGYIRTTIQAVARRAGVGPPAIYRRWANRVELVESALFPELRGRDVEITGDLRTDLQTYVDMFTATFATPAARAAVPALLSEYQSAPSANRSVALRLGLDVRRRFRELLDAQPPGTVDPAFDADDVLDVLVGAVIYRTFFLPFTGRYDHGDRTVDVLVRILRTTPEHHEEPT